MRNGAVDFAHFDDDVKEEEDGDGRDGGGCCGNDNGTKDVSVGRGCFALTSEDEVEEETRNGVGARRLEYDDNNVIRGGGGSNEDDDDDNVDTPAVVDN